jgi:hypothetical protein
MAQEIIETSQPRRDGGSWWEREREQETRIRSMNQSALHRFLGGPPLAVLFRLLLVSLIVGAFLMWFDIRPGEVISAVERFFRRIWNLGFDSIREIGGYIVAGAVIVVPVWLVIRLINMRGAR